MALFKITPAEQAALDAQFLTDSGGRFGFGDIKGTEGVYDDAVISLYTGAGFDPDPSVAAAGVGATTLTGFLSGKTTSTVFEEATEEIDDTIVSDYRHWSSTKINTELALKLNVTDSPAWGSNSISASQLTDTSTSGNNVYLVDTSANVTVTVSSADISGVTAKPIIIKDKIGNASTFNLVIATEGSQTIDGGSGFTIDTDHGSITLWSDGSNLYTLN